MKIISKVAISLCFIMVASTGFATDPLPNQINLNIIKSFSSGEYDVTVNTKSSSALFSINYGDWSSQATLPNQHDATMVIFKAGDNQYNAVTGKTFITYSNNSDRYLSCQIQEEIRSDATDETGTITIINNQHMKASWTYCSFDQSGSFLSSETKNCVDDTCRQGINIYLTYMPKM